MATAYLTHNQKDLRHLESWCIFRPRFDKDEIWSNQHPQPYLFPDSPGGYSYERYEMYKVLCLNHWHPSESWKNLDPCHWSQVGGPTPSPQRPRPAPLWWQYVTRPREGPV
uniref:NADH dehydrogenase [ubiquinone] 1 beta subcomplex subunit 9 n=1 Tax=Salmo trutta TaxID=8032 RepID=A0A674A2R5_SALTR